MVPAQLETTVNAWIQPTKPASVGGERIPMLNSMRKTGARLAPAMLAIVVVTSVVRAEVPTSISTAAPPSRQEGDKNLSPVPGWQFESGNAFANAGAAAVALGDVNGDGFGDFAVGAPNYDGPDPGQINGGAVFVFLGGPGGPSASPQQSFYSTLGSFGTAVAPAGDVNGDGYHDMLVGVPYAADGRAYLYLGSPSGLGGNPAWQYVHTDGGQALAQFASSLAPAGDVNGDGYDDVVIGANFSGDGAGAAFLFLGNGAGLGTSPVWTRTGAAGDMFGMTVSGAGDVNADGYADVIAGVPGADGVMPQGGDYFGVANVYHGSAAGLGTGPATRLYGLQTGANYASAVAGAGDVNGDGYADVAVGSSLFDGAGFTNNGRALIFPGGAGGVSGVPIWEEYGEANNIQLGATLATAGDVNGDGLADLAVGVPARINGSPNNGRALLVNGTRNGIGFLHVNWFVQRFNASGFGASVATAGDVDGDGFSDLLVGSPLYGNGQAEEGLVELFYGEGNPTSATYGQSVEGGEGGSFFGWNITSVGDVNGDGYDDSVVGGPALDFGSYDLGGAFLYLGSPNGLVYQLTWIGESTGSSFGSSISAAGDVNGDGYGDVIIGAHGTNTSGKAYVWYGSPSGPAGGAANWSVSFGFGVAQFGLAVAGAGDINHDGFADVIVGAPEDSNGEAGEGRAYVFFGSSSGLATTPARIYESNQEGAHLGYSVAGAGDVNRDGYSDFVIGVQSWDVALNPPFSFTDAGRALIYHGGAGWPADYPATVLDGNNSYTNFGSAVAAAGDVDGDGFGDIIVGARYADVAYLNDGEVRVYRGSTDGVSTTPHWSRTGGQGGAEFGAAIAGVGDVNGDGLSDILIGAPFADASGFADNGTAAVFAGPLTGAAGTTPIWSFAGQQDYENFGNGVGSAGDVNGDGFADLFTGSPGYTHYFWAEGRMLLFYGNGLPVASNMQSLAPRQRRGADTAPIAVLGSAGAPPALRLKAYGASPAGRSRVRLEWEVATLGSLLDGVGLNRSSWTDNGVFGVGNPPLLDSGSFAAPGIAAHWQLRVASRSPYFPHSPWLSLQGNGRQESDVLVVSVSTGTGDDVVAWGPSLPVTVAPNPFNPRTTFRFEVAQGGRVRVELFDVRGRAIAVLLDEDRPAGRAEVVWNGADGEGRPVSSGTYFARVTAAGQVGTARLLLVR